MNPIRERILDDEKGFVATGTAGSVPLEQEVAKLRGEVLKLKKLKNQADAYHSKKDHVETIQLTDKVQDLEKQVRSLRKENDKLKKAAEASSTWESQAKALKKEHDVMKKEWDVMVKQVEKALQAQKEAEVQLNEKAGELQNTTTLLEKAEAELKALSLEAEK